MSESQGHRMRPPGRRGLTLIESVIAVAILSLAITAVFGALTAGTAHVEAGADDLAATVAAEDLMSRLLAEDGADPSGWNGHRETAGALVDGNGIRLQGGVDRVAHKEDEFGGSSLASAGTAHAGAGLRAVEQVATIGHRQRRVLAEGASPLEAVRK